MEYLDLKNNFYILNKIQVEDKYVYICRDKNTFLYNFFYEKDNAIFDVEKNLFDKLKQIYKENTKDYVSFYCSNDYSKLEQQILSKAHSICRYVISDYMLDFDEELKTKFLNKLKTVAYNKIEIKNVPTMAFYKYTEHIINVNFNLNSPANFVVPTLLHELIHAISSNKKQTTTGILIDYDLKNKKNLRLKLNDAFNEAYTEIVRERLLEPYPEYQYAKTHISYYNPIKNLMNVMVGFVPNKTDLDVAYFNNDSYKFLDILCDAFKIENKDKMLNLSLQFDAFIDSLAYAVDNKENDKKTAFSYVTNMANTICDFVLNKYQKENLDIQNLKFSDIFKPTKGSTIIDDNYRYALIPVKTYFEQQKKDILNKKNIENKSPLNVEDYLKKYAVEFINCAFKNKTLNENFKEELKTPELFNLVLSNRFLKGINYSNLKDQKEIFETIFDKNKNFLPKDIKAQAKIVDNLLFKRDINTHLFEAYVPKDILSFIINKKMSTFNYLCEYNFDLLLNNIDNICYDRKYNKMFYINMLKNISTKPNKMEILKLYFKNMTPENRTKNIEQSGYLALCKLLKVLNDEEYLNLANYVKNLNLENDKTF